MLFAPSLSRGVHLFVPFPPHVGLAARLPFTRCSHEILRRKHRKLRQPDTAGRHLLPCTDLFLVNIGRVLHTPFPETQPIGWHQLLSFTRPRMMQRHAGAMSGA